MWYVLAAANALSGDADLIAGTQLKVPEMAASKNDATSFRPYNPGEIVGSTSPGLPYIPPAASNGCTYIIMAVVLIAVSIFVPPLAAAIAGPSAITVGWGATALATGIVTFGAHAVASAIGSASGMTTFSWRNSAAQGIAAGLTAGLAVKLGGTTAELIKNSAGIGKIAASAVGGALSNYAGNAIAGVKGNSFSWTAIAAASVADVATASIGNALGLVPKMVDGVKTTGNFGTDFAYSAIGGVVSLHTRRQFGFDDKVDYGAILGNAFATALGNAVGKNVAQTLADNKALKNMNSEQRQIYDSSMDQGLSKRQSLDYAMDVDGLRTMGNEWFGLGAGVHKLDKTIMPSKEENNISIQGSQDPIVVDGMVKVPNGTVKDIVSAEDRRSIAISYVTNIEKILNKQLPFKTEESAARAFRNLFAPMSGFLGLEFGANIVQQTGKYILTDIVVSDNFSKKTNLGWNAPIIHNDFAVAWAHTHPDLYFIDKRFSVGDLQWSTEQNQNAYVFYPNGFGRRFDYNYYNSTNNLNKLTIEQVQYYKQETYAKPFK